MKPTVALSVLIAGCATSGDGSDTPAVLPNAVVPDDAGAESEAVVPCTFGCNQPNCSADGWCTVSGPEARFELGSLWGSSPYDIWAAGAAGAIWHWDGREWKATPTGTDRRFFGVGGSGPDDVWAVSSGVLLRHTDGWHDGQPQWSPLTMGVLAKTTAVWASGPNDVWVTSMAETDKAPPSVWHSTGMQNGAASWEPASVGPVVGCLYGFYTGCISLSFNAIWGTSANDVWVVGEGGKVRHSRGWTSTGANWERYATPTVASLYGIWGSSSDDFWIVGSAGVILHGYIEDDTYEFERVASGTQENLFGIWGAAKDDVWVVGDKGTALHYDGVRWSPSATAPSGVEFGPLLAVWGANANNIWIVGRDVILSRTLQVGATQ